MLKAKIKDNGVLLYTKTKVKRDGRSETQMYPTYLRYSIHVNKIFKVVNKFYGYKG